MSNFIIYVLIYLIQTQKRAGTNTTGGDKREPANERGRARTAADGVNLYSRAGVNERGKTQRAGPANEQRRARTGADEGQPAQPSRDKGAGTNGAANKQR